MDQPRLFDLPDENPFKLSSQTIRTGRVGIAIARLILEEKKK